MSAMSCTSKPANATGTAPRPIRRWDTSRSQPSAANPLTDRPTLPGGCAESAFTGVRPSLSRPTSTESRAGSHQARLPQRRPAPASPDPARPASHGRAAWWRLPRRERRIMNSIETRRRIRVKVSSVCIIAVAAFIMLVPVLLNGFPFIFPDSGDYLILKPLIHRSPYYGLFIFIFHMNRWIWLPVLAQAIIVSHLLWLMLTITGARNISRNTVTLALLLTV